MNVLTRNGIEPVNFNKILDKITLYSKNLSPKIDPGLIAQRTIQSMTDGISTKELDELSAGISANLVAIHPDYGYLGARILMSRIHKELDIPNRTFKQNLEIIKNSIVNGIPSTRISEQTFDFVSRNEKEIEEIINYDRDMETYEYFALQGFITRGLEKVNKEIAEAPSQMFMRVAIGLNIYQERSKEEIDAFRNWSGIDYEAKRLRDMTDHQRLEQIKIYYELLSKREISLPGPIIMHAGSKKNQMASCFLEYCSDSLTEEEYPITGKVGGIMKAITQLAKQSQGGAGTAISLSNIRSAGSVIHSSNGLSNGILPFMKMIDSTIGAVNQSGKRAGVCTVYLEPWHADVLEFLDAGNHFTIEEKRCKNLFYALWMNDLFFERMTEDKQDAVWTLFDPNTALQYLDKPLTEYYGKEFKEKYLYLEKLGIGKTIPLMEIWSRVLALFQTTGQPYIQNKDSYNSKTNQQNIGIVHSSNICTEISLASSNDQTGVCVLTSICVSRYYDESSKDKIDYAKIINAGRVITRHLNNVIDLQYYPTPETRNSALTSRAIGIGLQGLADLFAIMKIDFDSIEAKKVNKRIYESLYFGAMWESMELARQETPYHRFEGSPVSKGILQYDMWGIDEESLFLNNEGNSLEILNEFGDKPWAKLKSLIKQYGVRNSEVTALAPTANASIRMAQNEMHEPFTRLVFVRQYIAGSIPVVNQYLVKDLEELGLWNDEMYNQIMYEDGSIQNISSIPSEIRSRYRTVYEFDYKDLIDMMADRSAFVSQSGSLNHYTSYKDAGPTVFTQKILYGWKKGLKSISYYMHSETASTAKKEMSGISKLDSVQPKESDSASQGEQFCDMTDPNCEFCST